MKIRSFRYLVGEGFKNIWANRLMSLASIGVLIACMLIMGVSIILSLNIDKALGDLSNQNVIMVYFYQELSDEDCLKSFEKVKATDNITADAATYITRDEGLETQLILAYGEDYTEEEAAVFERLKQNGNPIPNGARLQLDDLGKFDETIKALEKVEGVDMIQSHRDLAVKIYNIRTTVNNGCLWIIALLLIIAFVIVSNTIRITMYNRKLEISIMKAVGATNRFIRFPFLVEGVVLGVMAALLTTGVLYVVYYFAVQAIKDSIGITPIPFVGMVWSLLGIFALIGVVLGLLC
ncbi:MAG: ABC transporter permease, partial [Clostridia bacterium]|nr:ABC transporter permease [Clostridia bacterium]